MASIILELTMDATMANFVRGLWLMDCLKISRMKEAKREPSWSPVKTVHLPEEGLLNF